MDRHGRSPEATPLARRLPVDLMCRLLFGESSGRDLEPILRARGISLSKPKKPANSNEWFPRREVIFWAPDHF